jgi:hypothetical protein
MERAEFLFERDEADVAAPEAAAVAEACPGRPDVPGAGLISNPVYSTAGMNSRTSPGPQPTSSTFSPGWGFTYSVRYPFQWSMVFGDQLRKRAVGNGQTQHPGDAVNKVNG